MVEAAPENCLYPGDWPARRIRLPCVEIQPWTPGTKHFHRHQSPEPALWAAAQTRTWRTSSLADSWADRTYCWGFFGGAELTVITESFSIFSLQMKKALAFFHAFAHSLSLTLARTPLHQLTCHHHPTPSARTCPRRSPRQESSQPSNPPRREPRAHVRARHLPRHHHRHRTP